MVPSCASSVRVPDAPAPRFRSSASALSPVTSQLRICPPAKPISTRTKSSATGNHLRENAVDRIGMDERELDAEQPDARPVDDLRAGRLQLVERGAEIVRLERDVMHARATSREETPDRRVPLGRREQLDPALPDEQRRGFDALVGDGLATLEPG